MYPKLHPSGALLSSCLYSTSVLSPPHPSIAFSFDRSKSSAWVTRSSSAISTSRACRDSSESRSLTSARLSVVNLRQSVGSGLEEHQAVYRSSWLRSDCRHTRVGPIVTRGGKSGCTYSMLASISFTAFIKESRRRLILPELGALSFGSISKCAASGGVGRHNPVRSALTMSCRSCGSRISSIEAASTPPACSSCFSLFAMRVCARKAPRAQRMMCTGPCSM
mmetsp:Transcript_22686/g.73806  ORF Transcript_22686/g.73806 Transcript_22686/m.73806 type:complete len:222 (+) Transcript_22686:4509-5174(+)